MPKSTKTVIISDNHESIKLLKKVFDDTDYTIIFESTILNQNLSASWMIEPDLIIAAMDTTDVGVLAQMKTVYEQYPIPMVVFTQNDIDEGIEFAVGAGVNAYIVDGLKESRILPILKTARLRFEKHQQAQEEIQTLKTTMAERKIIDKAKGLLMDQRQCSEDEAYKLLRTTAMQQNQRMAVLAKNIIDAALLLQK
jgi:response regulator NasT